MICIGWESWRHCVFMVLVLDNIQFCWVRLFSIIGWWIVRERNRFCPFFVSPCYGMYATLCDDCGRWNWSIHIYCVNEYADRYILSCVRCIWWLVGYLLRMLQPQAKEERVWSSVTLDFHFHHGEMALALRMDCRCSLHRSRSWDAVSQESCHFTRPGMLFIPPASRRSLAFWPPRDK